MDINRKNTVTFEHCVRNFANGNAFWSDANRVTLDDKDVLYSINLVGLALIGDTGVLAGNLRGIKMNIRILSLVRTQAIRCDWTLVNAQICIRYYEYRNGR